MGPWGFSVYSSIFAGLLEPLPSEHTKLMRNSVVIPSFVHQAQQIEKIWRSKIPPARILKVGGGEALACGRIGDGGSVIVAEGVVLRVRARPKYNWNEIIFISDEVGAVVSVLRQGEPS